MEDNDAASGNGGSKTLKDAAYYKAQVQNEKAGKRKLYHSLVKLAEELKRLRNESGRPDRKRWWKDGRTM